MIKTMVFSDKGVTFENIEDPQGNVWFYKGRPYYVMTKKSDPKAYTPPDTITQLPEYLHRATDWQQTKRMLAYKNSMMEKVNLWLGIALIGILAWLCIMLVDMVGKEGPI